MVDMVWKYTKINKIISLHILIFSHGISGGFAQLHPTGTAQKSSNQNVHLLGFSKALKTVPQAHERLTGPQTPTSIGAHCQKFVGSSWIGQRAFSWIRFWMMEQSGIPQFGGSIGGGHPLGGHWAAANASKQLRTTKPEENHFNSF